jgi:NitT/TauT family transport system ATP-binding protein
VTAKDVTAVPHLQIRSTPTKPICFRPQRPLSPADALILGITAVQLQLCNIGHDYDALAVLAGISFAVASGEILGIIGPSGCGKSTLLSIIGGLIEPSRGEVLASGTPPPGCLNPLTYVFQDFALLPWRTVEGNIRLVLDPHPLSSAEKRERIDSVLAQTKLSDFREALPRQLSGGMRQRVGIARALAVNPAVLLMDEPLSALDAQTRLLLLDEFAMLFAASKTTVVYVTHNLGEAARLCHRVVALSRRPGRIKEIVDIATPLSARATHSATLDADEARLWSIIRDEAAAADRELVSPR